MKKNDCQMTFMLKQAWKSKLSRVMRATVFAIIVSVTQVLAVHTYSQNTPLTLNLKNTTVKNVLGHIQENSEFFFIYDASVINVQKEISIKAKNKLIPEILDEIFSGSNVVYKIDDRQIALTKANPLVIEIQQQKSVSGKVTDSSGLPLPGVTVVVKGTTQGTVTNADGEYSLTNISDDATLVFSFVGMKTQEIFVTGKANISLTMEEGFIAIGEVVAVGYGTQKRKEVTSSIATVKEKDFNKGAITQSPLQLVQGKIAGLAISRPSGGDPTKGIEIQLRGISTVSGDASPLVVIDGVPGGNLNTLAPEDIASIDILRDGSAAAIYGTRGNAGVIIITTKKGTFGKAAIGYSAYMYTEIWMKKPNILTASDWRQIKTDFQNSDNPFLKGKVTSIVDYGSDTDWLNEITRKNPLSNVHNLYITGGTESTNYYASVNYRNLQGFIDESSNDILSGRLSLTHSELDGKLKMVMNLSNSIRKYHPVNLDAYNQALNRNPTMPVHNEDGTFHETQAWHYYNPVALLKQVQRDHDRLDFLANTQVSYMLTRKLKVSANGAIQRYNETTGNYESKESFASISNGYNGSAGRSSYQQVDRTLESTLLYSNQFKNRHNLTALAGYSYQDFTNESFGASNRYFITDLFGYNNLGAGLYVPKGIYNNNIWSTKSSSKLIAFFGRVNYNYDDRYLISGSIRREGSTKFGKNNKWGVFPAVSAGWRIGREKFMENIDFINDLKLRIGYGITGNQGIGNYLSLQKLGTTGSMFYNGEWIPGYGPTSNANPDLRWEKKAETNLGIDISIFNNISASLDLYNRKTTDLLYNYEVPVPPYLYNNLWSNVGEIVNKGFEFMISAQPVKNQKFSWETNFNISYNNNKLVSLSNEEFHTTYLDYENLSGDMGMSGVNAYRLEEGQPIGNMFGYKFAGFTDDGKWLFWDKTDTEKLTVQEVKYEDKRVIGNGLPKSWIGFTNDFKYRNFDLTISFRGAFGFDILNTQRMWYGNISVIPINVFKEVLNNQIFDNPQYSDYYIENGAYIKLDNITIGYNIPVDKTFKELRLYACAQNLFTFTRYKGQDPEMDITGLSPGIDYHWLYPSVKTLSIGINVKF
jgi:TonB-dependent starch-binding outer membrane protein SusC